MLVILRNLNLPCVKYVIIVASMLFFGPSSSSLLFCKVKPGTSGACDLPSVFYACACVGMQDPEARCSASKAGFHGLL